jgi:hypothetical protein
MSGHPTLASDTIPNVTLTPRKSIVTPTGNNSRGLHQQVRDDNA